MQDIFQFWLFSPATNRLLVAILSLFMVWLVVRAIKQSLGLYIKDVDLRYRARKVFNFAGYLIGILILGTLYSDNLGRLTVILGVAGAGIAFALQEVISSLAGWFAISFAGFFKVGDRVQLGGIKGDVIDIGFLRTTIMEIGEWVKGDLYSGRVVRIANSFVFKEPVFNYSGDFPFIWDEIVVPVRYGSDYHLARQILQTVAEQEVGEYTAQAAEAWKEMVKRYLIEDARIEPVVTLVATDNWLEFTVRYVTDYKRRRITKDRLFVRTLDELKKTNARVTLASMTVEIVAAPVMDIQFTKKTPEAPISEP